MSHLATLSLRPFEPERDFPSAVEVIGAANINGGHNWIPSVAGLTVDWARRSGYEPSLDARVAESHGRIIAVGRTSWREREGGVVHAVQVWVHPEQQRQGIGRRLVAWGEERARAVAAEASSGTAELEHRFGGVTDKDNTAAVGLLASAGYTPYRYHYEMRRDLAEPVPEPALPDGLKVRPVVPDHHRAIWRADAEAFRDHWDASAVHEEDFERFFAHPNIDTSLWQVAWDGDEIAGMVINGINRAENARIGIDVGWLDDVSTRRPWRRRGLATTLVARSLLLLRQRGMTLAALGVDIESPTGALGVYERLGFRPLRTWAFYGKPF